MHHMSLLVMGRLKMNKKTSSLFHGHDFFSHLSFTECSNVANVQALNPTRDVLPFSV